MGAFLSRITMSAIVGALVAGGLVYLNMSQGLGRMTDAATASATAEALETLRSENAAILGELENDLADIAAEILTIKQTLAANSVHNIDRHEDMVAALAAIQARLETQLSPAPASAATPEPVEE